MTAVERRQEILIRLSYRRFDTLSNLANEFSVCKRTIQRDIEILSCSVPLSPTRGKGGGIYIADGFYVSKIYLTSSQENLLRSLSIDLQPSEKIIMQTILDTFACPKAKSNL